MEAISGIDLAWVGAIGMHTLPRSYVKAVLC